MSLEFIDWEIDGITVLTLSGRLTLGPATAQFRDTIGDLVSRGKVNIVLNMRDVMHIDSSGLGDLVTAYTACKTNGGRLKLSNLGERSEGLLQLTRLVTVFEIFTNEDEAVRSFAPPPEEEPVEAA